MNKELARALKHARGSRNADAAIPLYSNDAVFEDGVGPEGKTVRGRAAIRRVIDEMFTLAAPAFEVTKLTGSREGVAAAWIYSWDRPEPGQRSVTRGSSVVEIRDGVIVRETSYFDPRPIAT